MTTFIITVLSQLFESVDCLSGYLYNIGLTGIEFDPVIFNKYGFLPVNLISHYMHVYINILRETKVSKWAICNKCKHSVTIFHNFRNYKVQIIYIYTVDNFDFPLAVYMYDTTVCAKNCTKLWIN